MNSISFKPFFKFLTHSKYLFSLIVVIPFVLSVLYFSFFAVDRYVSNAQVVVKQSDSAPPSAALGLALLAGSSDPASREYTLYLKEYINSYDMLKYLDDTISWSQHYSEHKTDPFYSLLEDEVLEDKLEFYNKMVTTYFDDTTGLLSIEVQALTSSFAEEIINKILERGKHFINTVSREMALEKSEFANTELQISISRYQNSKDELQAFQNRYGLLDIEASASSKLEIVSALESEIAAESVRLKSLETTLSKDAPQIKALKNKISSLEKQLEIETGKLTSTSDVDDSFNVIASEYRQLQVNMLVAEEFYKASLALMETAKLEAIKNVRSLITVVKPVQPENAIYPKTLYNLITILIVLLLIYGVLRFVIASIEDHYE